MHHCDVLEPPELQEALKASTTAWQADLHALFINAKDRYPDVEQVGVYAFIFCRHSAWVPVIIDEYVSSVPKFEELNSAENAFASCSALTVKQENS